MDGPSPLALGLILSVVLASPAIAQDVDRENGAATAARIAKEADSLFEKKEFAAALKLYESEREVRSRLGDLRYEAHALRGKGCCLAELGDEPSAIAAWESAREVDLKRDDPGFAGYDDLLIARAQVRLGTLAEATKSLNRSIPRLGQAVDRDHLADARLLQAQIAFEQERPDDAIRQARRALDLATELKDNARAADARAVSGSAFRAKGDLAEALKQLGEAQRTYDRLNRPDASARLEPQIAEVLHGLGRPEQAAERFASASRRFAELQAPSARLGTLQAEATIRLDLKQTEVAEKIAREAVDLAKSSELEDDETDARVLLAKILDLRGKPAEAVAALQPALPRTREDLETHAERHVLICVQLAGYARKAKADPDAKAWLDEAERIAKAKNLDALTEVIRRAR